MTFLAVRLLCGTKYSTLHDMTASILYPSITIRLRRLPDTFWHLVRSIVRASRFFFVAANFFFVRAKNSSKSKPSSRCLSRFKFGNFTCHFWANSADRPRICANLMMMRTNPGTISRILQKVAGARKFQVNCFVHQNKIDTAK